MESLAIKTKVSNHGETRRKPIGQGAHALSQALNRLVEQGVLPSSKYTDFLGQLTVYLNQAFQAVSVLQASARAMITKSPQDNDAPWDWFLIHQDEDVRCGVISVNPYRPVPVHDHTCSSGILLVLEGQLVERCFQLDVTSEPETGQTSALAVHGTVVNEENHPLHQNGGDEHGERNRHPAGDLSVGHQCRPAGAGNPLCAASLV